MSFTFHRAFDWVSDPFMALSALNEIKVDAILSSGQQGTAMEGMELLKQLKALSTHLAIMPGGGINENNISDFVQEKFPAVHFSGTKFHQTLAKPPKVAMNSALFLREDHLAISDLDKIKSVMKSVK